MIRCRRCLGSLLGLRSAILMPLAATAMLVGLASLARAQVRGSTDQRRADPPPGRIYVDAERGHDGSPGSAQHPLRSISAAIAMLPDPLSQSVTIELRGERFRSTGGVEMSERSLELMRRMRPGVTVTIQGQRNDNGRLPALAWEGERRMIVATEGDWRLERVQIGTFSTRQRRGLMVIGPAHVTLKDVTFRLRSHSDAGVYADRGGKVSLLGKIRLNEHLHDSAENETFCGIIATDHGLVRFEERDGASLDIGNGSLSASYYGCIRLGCETARITSWGEQSNNLAINDSGRIDLHNTTVTLCAKRRRNTPIGLEDDGHILGEDAHVIIVGENESAIALQKASTFTCNDIEFDGEFDTYMWASSGSMFVGRFLSDVGRIEATTGANINIEKTDGAIFGPVVARHAARISLPNRDVLPE